MQQRGARPRRAGGGLWLPGTRCGWKEVLDREEQVSEVKSVSSPVCHVFVVPGKMVAHIFNRIKYFEGFEVLKSH